MNKRNFVYNYIMKKSDFDNLQNDIEADINKLANTLAGKGIVNGLDVRISGDEATVSAGTAFDGSGKRIKLPADVEVDLSGISRPSSEKYKWITLVIEHAVREEGQIVDGNNRSWPQRLLDSYSTRLLVGAEGTSQGATKPTVSDSQVPLLDIKVDYLTAFDSLRTDRSRRPYILDVIYPVGFAYAQYPGGQTPTAMGWPGIWEAQFETEGVFFRTPGGEALTFGSGIQEDAMQRITGYLGDFNDYAARRGVPTGALTSTQANPGTGIGEGKSDSYTSLNFDSSLSVSPNAAKTDDSETRPRNRTFRIWKRTA